MNVWISSGVHMCQSQVVVTVNKYKAGFKDCMLIISSG